MFADNSSLDTIGMNFKQVNDNLLNNITNVHDWYTNIKSAVNIPKTKVMLVTNKNALRHYQKLSIALNWHTLEHVKSMNCLDLYIDENLTF